MTYTPEKDLNHTAHSDTGHRYGCHNKPDTKLTEIQVQDGWTVCGKRETVTHKAEWLDIGCGHTWRRTDPSCTSCKWR